MGPSTAAGGAFATAQSIGAAGLGYVSTAVVAGTGAVVGAVASAAKK